MWPLGSGVEGAWDRLARETLAVPFARPGWVTAWASAFGRRVSVACVERDGKLVAALPVVVDGHSVATAADWHVPSTEVVALDHEAVITLLRGLDRAYRRIVLDFVVADSLTELVGSLVLEPRPRRRLVRLRSPWIDTTGPWDDYVAGLSGKKLRELRRRRRRLGEQVGPVTYEIVDGAGPWREALDRGLAVEASGWKGQAGTAVASAPATDRFYRAVAEWAAAEKILEVGVLRAGERVVAFDLALCDGARTWLLKTGFDHDLAAHATGQILRHDAIEAAFRRGLESYEFTGDAEEWKREWTDRERPVVAIDAHRRGPIGHATLLAARTRRAIRVRYGGRSASARASIEG